MKKRIIVIAAMIALLVSVSSVSADTWDCKSWWEHIGDINGDGLLGHWDVECLYEYYLSGQTSPIYDDYDVDYNGYFDIFDVYYLFNSVHVGVHEYPVYPGHVDDYRCWKAQYYDSIPLLNQWHTLQYIKYSEYTDENVYIPGVYVCHHFAVDLIESLRAKNVNAYYMWSLTDYETHAEVMVFPYDPYSTEKPMIFDQSRELQEWRRDSDEYVFNDIDGDGIVEYVEEVNFVNPAFAYYYIIYGEWVSLQTNVPFEFWETDDGNILIDQNYC